MSILCSTRLFGPSAQYIKSLNGDFVAVEGSNIMERLILSDLRIPYKQVLKSRIILKEGQVNYLLNFLGLGDNATFLAIKAYYSSKSTNEKDNYISWSYYDDLTRINYFSDLMVLTGNSEKRIPQIYLTNPNEKYQVHLDVMVAIIDDNYSIFTDTLNQSGSSFVGLEYTDIHSHVVGQSIVINDKSDPVKPLIYIMLNDINHIEISGKILIIDDSSRGSIFLQFLTDYDVHQAHSLLNYVLENPNIDIDALVPLEDDIPPVVYFYANVGDDPSLDYIAFNGSTMGVPYNTGDGYTFSATVSLTQSGTASGYIDKQQLINLFIDYIEDNRDGYMYMIPSNVLINSYTGSIDKILTPGTYSVTFDFKDIAYNSLEGVIFNTYVIT
jgi:hypothetical protein